MNAWRITFCLVIAAAMLIAGCTDAEWDRNLNYGQEHHIRMYSGGVLIEEWNSTGKIHSEKDSDGYYFRSKETGKLVTVSGDVIIEVVE